VEQIKLDMPLSEFEYLTANQIAIGEGNEEPSCKNIIEAVRIASECNNYRINKGLKPFK